MGTVYACDFLFQRSQAGWARRLIEWQKNISESASIKTGTGQARPRGQHGYPSHLVCFSSALVHVTAWLLQMVQKLSLCSFWFQWKADLRDRRQCKGEGRGFHTPPPLAHSYGCTHRLPVFKGLILVTSCYVGGSCLTLGRGFEAG